MYVRMRTQVCAFLRVRETTPLLAIGTVTKTDRWIRMMKKKTISVFFEHVICMDVCRYTYLLNGTYTTTFAGNGQLLLLHPLPCILLNIFAPPHSGNGVPKKKKRKRTSNYSTHFLALCIRKKKK